MNLGKKRALVVCGTSPLGIAISRRFAYCGAQVVATGRAASLPKLQCLEPPISTVELDLTQSASICSAVQKLNQGEKIDFLVFACGYLPGRSLDEYDDDEIDMTFAINVVAQTKLLKGVLGHINKAGLVLFISSIAATAGSYDPVYAAAKAAQIGLMKSLAKHHGHKIRVNVLAPGTISDSPMAGTFSEANLERHVRETPTGRLNTSKELAQIVVDVCGEAWANLNGQVIAVNGGRYV